MPWDDDVGTHVFYVFAYDSNNRKIIQSVYLTIMASKEMDVSNSSLSAKIDSISRNGKVVILFNELLALPTFNNTNDTEQSTDYNLT